MTPCAAHRGRARAKGEPTLQVVGQVGPRLVLDEEAVCQVLWFFGRPGGRQPGGFRTALFEAIASDDIHALLAGITLPNVASVALHERFGFTLAGVTHAVGRKFDRYWDVGWFERILG